MLVAYSRARASAKSRLTTIARETAKARGTTLVLRAGLAGVAILAFAAALAPQAARAQGAECQDMVKILKERESLLQQWQAMQRKKQVTPAGACNLFTQLSSKVASAIPEVEKNGTWCHLPDQVLAGLKEEQGKVNKARGDACKAVAMQKKMESQRAQQQGRPGPLGGGDSVVGGPIKMPQGAL